MNFYKNSCPQAEDIIRDQVSFSTRGTRILPSPGSGTSSMIVESRSKRSLSEKESDRSFGMRNYRYLDTIKEAVERECPQVVSYADILVLSARDGIVEVEGTNSQSWWTVHSSKNREKGWRRSRVDILEQDLPDHNESISVVLDKFAAIGIDTPAVVALLGAHCVGRTRCVKLVHRLYPDLDPNLNPYHIPGMLKKRPDPIPDSKVVQFVRNDRETPMKLDNNYYRNILGNKGLLLVDH
ncbi:peroxidase 42-like [Asparagus officinalis]|uniref:peroxidase 42-like n=1 Tax=Asparagus officinalis TaxID=4686 RepID=UPI00098DF9E4|nr:peroxidase 42-like [Asparagus officinalis]